MSITEEIRDADKCAYNEWVSTNQDYIFEVWVNGDPEPPEDIYLNVLDDEYPDVYDKWASTLAFEDVPEHFVQEMYENYLEYGDEDV